MQNENPIAEVARFFKNIDYDIIINNAELGLEYIKKQATKGSIETTRMLLELYYVMMDDNSSKLNKLIIGSALAYQFLPNDFSSSALADSAKSAHEYCIECIKGILHINHSFVNFVFFVA